MSKSKGRDPPTPELARSVQNLYDHKITGRPIDDVAFAALDDADKRDANAMAAALVLIRQLVDQYYKYYTSNPRGLPHATGVQQAYSLLDALTTGKDWTPFWRYFQILQSTTRHQNAPPSAFDNKRRSVVAGLVLALMRTDWPDDGRERPPNGRRLLQAEAIRMVIDYCKFEDVAFTPGQIRGWINQSKDQGGEGPEREALRIINKAERWQPDPPIPLIDRVLHAGRTEVWVYWEVPKIVY